MPASTSCPTKDQLRSLLDGTARAPDQALLQEHLNTCDTCQQTLEGLVAGRDSWSVAKHQLGGGEHPSEPELDDLMKRAKEAPGRAETQGESVGAESEAAVLARLGPAQDPNHIGRLGHYEIIQVVGRGGFGVVLKAFDTSLRRVVAIKVLTPHLAASATARRRFVREARAAAAVIHEHVVAIHAVEDSYEPPYFVMQFVEGKTLQDRIDSTASLSVSEIVRIGMQAAAGLAAAHAQGLVHRDIKPANILLENGVERVKITDFGLARTADDASLTQSGVVAGTPQYMAPEQASGEPLDYRADLFSLGSVLYAMCTGRPPFRASTTMGVLKRVCEETPRPIRELNPEIPEWLESIVTRLLAKRPADRFQSASELRELLGQHLAHLQQPTLVSRPRSTAPAPTATTTQPSYARFVGWPLLAGFGILAIAAALLIQSGSPREWLIVTLVGSLLVFPFAAIALRLRWSHLAAATGQPIPGGRPAQDHPVAPALRSQVSGPARLLVVAGALNWVMLFGVIVASFIFAYRSGHGITALSHESAALIVVAVILFMASGVIIFGAIRMLHFESFAWAVAATLAAMFVGPGYVVGWPAGIWALAVLTRPEVRRAFAAVRTASIADSAGATPYHRTPLERRMWWRTVVISSCVIAGFSYFVLRPLLTDSPQRQSDTSDNMVANVPQNSPANPTATDIPNKYSRVRSDIAWGPASPVGVQLGILLDPARDAYRVGELVKLRVFLHNGSDQQLFTTLPRLEVLEKFDFDLSLRDDQNNKLPWAWGSAHHTRELLTVSGATALRIPIGADYELPAAAVSIGRSGSNPAMASLEVDPGQRCRLACSLGTYGYAKGEGEPLASDAVEFRVEPAVVSDAGTIETEELDRLVKLAERDLQRVLRSVQAGAEPSSAAFESESKLIDAQLRLARVRNDFDAIVTLLGRLVQIRDTQRSHAELRVKQGVAPASESDEAERQLIEAKLRLKNAENEQALKRDRVQQ